MNIVDYLKEATTQDATGINDIIKDQSAYEIYTGNSYVKKGTTKKGEVINEFEQQLVYGTAINTKVKAYGKQLVYGGCASGTKVSANGDLGVLQGGIAKKITVAKDGIVTITGGTLDTASISGGVLTFTTSAQLNGAESTLYLMTSGNKDYIAGSNKFYKSDIAGGSPKQRVIMKKNAVVAVTNSWMGELYLDARQGKLIFSGDQNTFKSLYIGKNSKISYDITKKSANSNDTLLFLESQNKQKCGKFTISTKKNQKTGVYSLSTNIIQKNNTAYSLTVGSVNVGTVKLNSSALAKNGMTYTLASSGAEISLAIAMKAGKMLKGTAKANKLTGSSHSDIFYGGKGNDTLSGVNGRDVAVYDKTKWGKDKILKTGGTMTILFKDLKKTDVVQKLKGTTMTLTRKGDKSQSVTVEGWDKATHNVVFGDTMSAFGKWLTAAKPSTVQTKARNEVWKKAGLAQA